MNFFLAVLVAWREACLHLRSNNNIIRKRGTHAKTRRRTRKWAASYLPHVFLISIECIVFGKFGLIHSIEGTPHNFPVNNAVSTSVLITVTLALLSFLNVNVSSITANNSASYGLKAIPQKIISFAVSNHSIAAKWAFLSYSPEF